MWQCTPGAGSSVQTGHSSTISSSSPTFTLSTTPPHRPRQQTPSTWPHHHQPRSFACGFVWIPGGSVTLSTYLRGVIHSRVSRVLVSPDMMTSPGKQRQILLIQHPTRCRCLALLCTHAARHKAPVFSALFIELNFRKFQSLETWSSQTVTGRNLTWTSC